MKVKSIKTGKQVTWDTKTTSYPMKSKAACRSNIQYEIGQLFKDKYPLDPILEDITIPDSRLSLDFFLPRRLIGIEVQGEQHYEQNSFFHKSKEDFEAQKQRDADKITFCELNDITLLRFNSVKQCKEFLNVD